MGTFRMWSDANGVSHFEEIDLKDKPDWVKGVATTQLSFREWKVGEFYDWHPAPRRQFVIILSGQLEVILGDGTKRLLNPGDLRLVEDTTGKGHQTRTVGNQPCLTVAIPLAQQ
jgi:quercetin dioxygenase-like cupin family protein